MLTGGARFGPRPRASDPASTSTIALLLAFLLLASSVSFLAWAGTHSHPSEPAGLVATDLDEKARDALALLVDETGFPVDWARSPAGVDAVARLGLRGAHAPDGTIDATKLDALVHGKLNGASPTNGLVDYSEARAALGLAGYDFHLRTQPVFSQGVGTFGVTGMADHRVVYVGSTARPDEAASEAASLSQLAISFHDQLNDSPARLRAQLLPQLGARFTEAVISPAGAQGDFRVVDAATVASAAPHEPSPSHALALTDAGGRLGYAPARELRALFGPIDLAGEATSATVSWRELVSTGLDANDFGLLEVSADGGRSWRALDDVPGARSTDIGATALSPRSLTIDASNCAECLGNARVYVALHWIADGTPATGAGWIVDDLTIRGSDGATRASETFEPRAFDTVVVGSDVDGATLGAPDIGAALARFVAEDGGRLLVLGGPAQEASWLQPFYHLATRDENAPVGQPDPDHPLLNVPNALGYPTYVSNGAWNFSGSPERSLFEGILSDAPDHDQLAASTLGAFGPQDGGLVLTTFKPASLQPNEAAKLLANALLFGRYQHLYGELGPSVPTDTQVSGDTRLALVDTGSGAPIRLLFKLYTWRGQTDGVPVLPDSPPSAPRALLVATPAPLAISWNAPTSNGSTPIRQYAIYRGSAPNEGALLATVGTNTTFFDATANPGVTYFYNVTAINGNGPSSSTRDVQATPLVRPTAPVNVTATRGTHQISLAWSPPLDSGGSRVTAYRIWESTQPGQETLFATVGANTTFVDVGLGNGVRRYYELTAIAGGGESLRSVEVSATTLDVPQPPGTPTVQPGLRQLSLSWSAAASGLPVTSYRIYAGNASGGETWLMTVDGATLSATETGLGDGQTRYYVVTATNDVGESLRSGESTGTTFAPPGAPTLAASGGVASISLAWAAPRTDGGSPITAYDVYAGSASGSESYLATIGPNTTFVEARLAPSQTRYYQVSAVNLAGEGPRSNETSATTFALPAAPRALSVVGGLRNLTFSWTPPATNGGAPVTAYQLYVGTTSGNETLLATTANTTFVQSGLPNGALRYARVSAVTAVGEGPLSNEASGVTFDVPGAPQGLVARAVGLNISLNWTPPASTGGSPITGYRLFAGNASGTESLLATTGTNTTFVHVGLPACSTRYYKVAAQSIVGVGPNSTEANATTQIFTILANGGISVPCATNLSIFMVGSQITYGAGGPNVPVDAKYSSNAGTTWITLWGGAPIQQGAYANMTVVAGSTIAIRGHAHYGSFDATHDSNVGDAHVRVLKNGDATPNVPAFANQASLASFLQPYATNGTITIASNQAIMLYEFNPSLTSSAADFQDMVLLMTFT